MGFGFSVIGNLRLTKERHLIGEALQLEGRDWRAFEMRANGLW